VRERDQVNHGICNDETESVIGPLPFANRIVPVNSAPADFDAARDLPEASSIFLRRYTPRSPCASAP